MEKPNLTIEYKRDRGRVKLFYTNIEAPCNETRTRIEATVLTKPAGSLFHVEEITTKEMVKHARELMAIHNAAICVIETYGRDVEY